MNHTGWNSGSRLISWVLNFLVSLQNTHTHTYIGFADNFFPLNKMNFSKKIGPYCGLCCFVYVFSEGTNWSYVGKLWRRILLFIWGQVVGRPHCCTAYTWAGSLDKEALEEHMRHPCPYGGPGSAGNPISIMLVL